MSITLERDTETQYYLSRVKKLLNSSNSKNGFTPLLHSKTLSKLNNWTHNYPWIVTRILTFINLGRGRQFKRPGTNRFTPWACWESVLGKNEEGRDNCPQHPGWEGCQPGGNLSANYNQCKLSVFWDQPRHASLKFIMVMDNIPCESRLVRLCLDCILYN